LNLLASLGSIELCKELGGVSLELSYAALAAQADQTSFVHDLDRLPVCSERLARNDTPVEGVRSPLGVHGRRICGLGHCGLAATHGIHVVARVTPSHLLF
jgi:hypothetical protein